MKLLVTGSNGFIGTALVTRLEADGHHVVPATRKMVGNIDGTTHWKPLLDGCDVVIHLAARVHVMSDQSENPLAVYRQVNVEGTLNLAKQAALAGVKRFVFISTAKVHGEGKPEAYTETDIPLPEDAYAISKWEAEQKLRTIAADTGMESVILRPPLVYGAGVGANFLALLRLVERGIPLPLAAIRNRRSMVFVKNLVDATCVCAVHPAAAHQVFLISDGSDVSSPDLVRLLATAAGKKATLLPVPSWMLRVIGMCTGKQAQIIRLTGSFSIDSRHIRHTLGWAPPFSLEDGISQTVRWHLNRQH